MDNTHIYAIVAAGLVLCLLLRRGWPFVASHLAPFYFRVSKFLAYRYVLRRHALIGPWTVLTVLAELIYLAVNVVCLALGAANWSQIGQRAGTLSVIHLGLLSSGLNLSFLASLLGLSLGTVRAIHHSAGFMTLGLVGCHIVVAAATDKASFQWEALKPFGLTAASTLCLLSIVPRRLVQKLSYEIFLRVHQVVSLACAYSTWRHVPSERTFPHIVLYICGGLLGATFVGEAATVLVRNGCSYGRGSRVTITSTCGMVKLQVHLAKPLKVEPGQYLNLWIPSVSLGAFLQSHPFLVTSWSANPLNTVDIFVQPRRGLTRGLLRVASRGAAVGNRWAMFSGPYGQTIAAGKYEKVVMVADEVGIAAQLPYLQKLIHGYHTRQGFTRRIHLIWQISDIGVGMAAQPYLNNALDEDKLDSDGILQISIYVDVRDVSTMTFGKRSTVYPGMADLDHLVGHELTPREKVRGTEMGSIAKFSPPVDGLTPYRESVTSKYSTDDFIGPNASRPRRRGTNLVDGRAEVEEGVPGMRPSLQGTTLILVSAHGRTRDTLRKIVRRHLRDKIELAELEFQPVQD